MMLSKAAERSRKSFIEGLEEERISACGIIVRVAASKRTPACALGLHAGQLSASPNFSGTFRPRTLQRMEVARQTRLTDPYF